MGNMRGEKISQDRSGNDRDRGSHSYQSGGDSGAGRRFRPSLCAFMLRAAPFPSLHALKQDIIAFIQSELEAREPSDLELLTTRSWFPSRQPNLFGRLRQQPLKIGWSIYTLSHEGSGSRQAEDRLCS